MKKNTFKFKLGDKVFYLGRAGVCLIHGRGRFHFASGGEVNYYILDGAMRDFAQETVLLSPREFAETNQQLLRDC